MQIFNAGGREWVIQVDLPAVETSRAKLGFDLGALDCSQLDALSKDQVLVGNVLWMLVEEQAEKASVSRKAFLSTLHGDAGRLAYIALIESVIDFFPSHQREALRAMLMEHLKAEEQIQIAMKERLAKQVTASSLSKKAIEEMNRKLDELLGPL